MEGNYTGNPDQKHEWTSLKVNKDKAIQQMHEHAIPNTEKYRPIYQEIQKKSEKCHTITYGAKEKPAKKITHYQCQRKRKNDRKPNVDRMTSNQI